jgi:hypothetical protein
MSLTPSTCRLLQGYELGDWGIVVGCPPGVKDILSSKRLDRFGGLLCLLLQWVPGSLSLGLKPRGRESHHPPPCSAAVKNAWSCTSAPLTRLHGVHSDDSTITLRRNAWLEIGWLGSRARKQPVSACDRCSASYCASDGCDDTIVSKLLYFGCYHFVRT